MVLPSESQGQAVPFLAALLMNRPAGYDRLVEKRTFTTKDFRLRSGAVLPEVRVGYETYGRLSPSRDNAILICHYLSGTSHAAGRYSPADPGAGYWDPIIGPGKPFDTDRYFVVSSDTLCNMNAKDPQVVTTGPASIDPRSGRPYGMNFPLVSFTDIVNVQRLLLESLGIQHLVAVAGPSMGGMQALAWAVASPALMDKIIPVISIGRLHPWTMVCPLRISTDCIMADPRWNGGDYYGREEPTAGVVLALKILTTMALGHRWADEAFGRRPADPGKSPDEAFDDEFLVEREIARVAQARAALIDANSYIHLVRANIRFDLAQGYGSFEEAVGRIRARSLFIPCASDLFLPPYQSREVMDLLRQNGVPAAEFVLESRLGHLGGVVEIDKAAGAIRDFLEAP